jgi:hypothetical protein
MVMVKPVEPSGIIRGAARVAERRERVARRVVSEYMIAENTSSILKVFGGYEIKISGADIEDQLVRLDDCK